MALNTLPPGAVKEGEFTITRTLPHGRRIQIGRLIMYRLNGELHYKGVPDPATPDNMERLQQIIKRRMERDGFYRSRLADPAD